MILGVDVGGTKIVTALGERDGRVLGERRRASPPDFERAVAGVIADARALCAEATSAKIEAIGISAPAPLDRAAGLVRSPPNLPGWDDAPVAGRLATAFDAPAFLENDANASALAEWHFGAGQGVSRLVFLTMSTGVGGGLILDGRLYRGRDDLAGEIGHVCVDWNGAHCACGQRGCLEAYVGGRAWTQHLRGSAPDASDAVRIAGDRAHLLPEHVVLAARAGDAFALAELERFSDYLARGLAIVAGALAPDRIVLGTIVAAAGEELCLRPVRAKLAARVRPEALAGLQVVAAELAERGPALAGLCVALDGLAGSG